MMIRQLQTLLVVITMLGYLAANVEFESLHELAHHDEEISHSEADEKDACHRHLYHDDFSKGCAHKTHFVASKKCGLCDHHLSVDKVFHSSEWPMSTIVAHDIYSCNHDSFVNTPAVYIPARGPPTV